MNKMYNKSVFKMTFTLFKYLDILLIGIAILLNLMVIKENQAGYIIMNFGILLFVIIEYINYFLYRISHPLNEFIRKIIKMKFPKSKLYKELNG